MENKPSKSTDRDAYRLLIEEMLQLMEERGLVELEIEQQGMRIRLKKATAAPASVIEYAAAPAPGLAAAASAKPAEPVSPKTQIKSPMVGTFYRAPSPDAPAFVEVGQEIAVGQVICIIEAMKLMNEIKAEVAGRVSEIHIQSGDAVEFSQVLFSLEPRP